MLHVCWYLLGALAMWEILEMAVENNALLNKIDGKRRQPPSTASMWVAVAVWPVTLASLIIKRFFGEVKRWWD